MRRIKFVDLGRLHEPIKSELNEVVSKIVEKNNYILGEELVEFEDRWAKYTGQKYAIGVSSGYHALELSKIACLRDLTQIAVPTNSFIATANAFNDYNHCVYFLDINSDNLLLDVEKLEYILKLGQPIECVVPVHLYGQPCNMEELKSECDRHDIKIIEDACQAHGVNNKLIGKGVTTCYSFYPSKNLGCFGDGGMITTNDEGIAGLLKLLRSNGEERKNVHSVVGYNCRLDTLQAGVLNVKLDYLNEWNNQRREIAKQYHEELDGIDCIKLLPYNEDSVYHLFVVEVNGNDGGENRDNLRSYLSKHGIETGIHYPTCIHKQKAYNLDVTLPIAEEKAKRILSLPMYPGLEADEVSYVCNAIKNFD